MSRAPGRVLLPVLSLERPLHHSLTFRAPSELLEWLRETNPRIYAKIENGFIPEGAPSPAGGDRQAARAARRRAVARKARI